VVGLNLQHRSAWGPRQTWPPIRATSGR